MTLPSGFATLRDAASFTMGAALLFYCIVVRDPPADPVGVAVGVALAGLPMVTLGGRREPPSTPDG